MFILHPAERVACLHPQKIQNSIEISADLDGCRFVAGASVDFTTLPVRKKRALTMVIPGWRTTATHVGLRIGSRHVLFKGNRVRVQDETEVCGCPATNAANAGLPEIKAGGNRVFVRLAHVLLLTLAAEAIGMLHHFSNALELRAGAQQQARGSILNS